MTELVIIAALAANGVIGVDGTLPWRLPADLRRFRTLTSGHPVVMGRRTFESIGRPLPNRTNMVLSRDPDFVADGCWVFDELADAITMSAVAPGGHQVWIIGGGDLYRSTIDVADRLELTVLDADIDGDTWFPDIDDDRWTCVVSERHEADDHHATGFEFRTYERSLVTAG